MKSLVNNLLAVALGVCKDIKVAYPQYAGLDLDIERLARTCRSRGLGFFTLDLPNLDSLLIEGLREGRLRPRGPLSRVVSKGTNVPKFLSGLWLRIFDKNACLKEDADVNAILFLRQISVLGKKVEVGCSPERFSKAIEEYHDIERKIRPATLKWEADEFDPDLRLRTVHLCDSMDADLPLFPRSSRPEEMGIGSILKRCQHVADIISRELGFFEPITFSGDLAEESGTGFKHGPGAVADRSGIVNKYDMPRWSSKLEAWFPYRECGTIASDLESIPLNHERPSKLIAVPKTAKTPRLIAAEPTEHQWCQQLIKRFMTDRLRSVFGKKFICFEEQSLSGAMVLQASLDRSLATLDLSSASDRLSCWLVERVFRSNPSLLHALHATRTRYLYDKHTSSDSFIKLKKFASQGTAVTFPVQSFVFLCLAIGTCIDGKVTWSKIRRLSDKVRVYGDDIIVPNDRYVAVARVLNHLGLKVNEEKSFSLGNFRESCGTDAFKGYDITPVKPRSLSADGPTSRQALLDSANNLFKKGFWNASNALESTPGNRHLRRLPVVGRDSGVIGRTSFCGRNVDHLDKRWNHNLHRTEYRVWRSKSASRRTATNERFALLQYFTEAPALSGNRWEHGMAKRPKTSDGLGWEPLYEASTE